MAKRLILEFPDSDSRAEWVGWYLDAGGEEDQMDYMDLHGLTPLSMDSTDEWPWSGNGKDDYEHFVSMVKEG